MSQLTDVLLVIERADSPAWCFTVYHVYDSKNKMFLELRYPHEHVVEYKGCTVTVMAKERFDFAFISVLVKHWWAGSEDAHGGVNVDFLVP